MAGGPPVLLTSARGPRTSPRDRRAAIRDPDPGSDEARHADRSSRAPACRVRHGHGRNRDTEAAERARSGIRSRSRPDTPAPDGARSRSERLHRKRAGLPRVDERRRSAAALAHQRRQARHQRGQLLGRRQRPREQRELHDARRASGSTATTTRSMAAAGGCDSRSSSASVRSVRASRIGAGSCSDRSCTVRVDQMQPDVQHGGAAIAPLEMRGQRLHAAGRARTTAARALRSATRDRAPARTAPPAPRARSGRGSSPRASRCHCTPACPSRAATSSGRQRRADRRACAMPHRGKLSTDRRVVRAVRTVRTCEPFALNRSSEVCERESDAAAPARRLRCPAR